MSVYQIVKEGNPVLREKALPITNVNDAAIRLLNNLRDTLMVTPKGVGLAAPQIGISKRAFVVQLINEEEDEHIYYEMINPELTEMEGREESWEGCLSVPELEGLIPRAKKLKVKYTDRESRKNELIAEGYLARVIQHEYDHLNGVLFPDKALSIKDTTQTEENRTQNDGAESED
ncbi:MAG: peptide deformylase [Clostridiales bacterium]|nr:peptide deformylase [Clostridiales bacterium]